ncbi:hypothetical protein F5878DRAFT_503622, partial [Lentinula raphanica]
VAVELCLRTLIASHITNATVWIRSDNTTVVGCLKKGNSRGSEQNFIIRKIIELMQLHKVWVKCTWISTKDNPADGPSRGIFP